jgi:hypothetical protein
MTEKKAAFVASRWVISPWRWSWHSAAKSPFCLKLRKHRHTIHGECLCVHGASDSNCKSKFSTCWKRPDLSESLLGSAVKQMPQSYFSWLQINLRQCNSTDLTACHSHWYLPNHLPPVLTSVPKKAVEGMGQNMDFWFKSHGSKSFVFLKSSVTLERTLNLRIS